MNLTVRLLPYVATGATTLLLRKSCTKPLTDSCDLNTYLYSYWQNHADAGCVLLPEIMPGVCRMMVSIDFCYRTQGFI
ncbi:MAG: hypothetical protein KME49_14945 [Brasilonema octagenarum HA4186-MV1]|nr:hypothetical protein [Brasilonema octagenarum]MBW4626753.1 hypothetical protein [Brasilonema octagenarum HA4186-MV1]